MAMRRALCQKKSNLSESLWVSHRKLEIPITPVKRLRGFIAEAEPFLGIPVGEPRKAGQTESNGAGHWCMYLRNEDAVTLCILRVRFLSGTPSGW